MSNVTLPTNFSLPSSIQTNAQIDLTNSAITTVCNYVCTAEVKLLAGEYERTTPAITNFSRGDMRGFIDAFGLQVAFTNTVNSTDSSVRALFQSYVDTVTYVAEARNGSNAVTTIRADTLATFILSSISPSYVSLNPDILSQLQRLVRVAYTSGNIPNPSSNVRLFNSVSDIAANCVLSNGDSNVTSGVLSTFTGPSTWGVGKNYPNLVLPFTNSSDAQSSFDLVIKSINSSSSYTAGANWVTTSTTTGVTSVTPSGSSTAHTMAQLLTAYNGYVRTRDVSINQAHPIGMSTYMNEQALVSYYSPAYYGQRALLVRGWSTSNANPGIFTPGFAFDAVLAAYTNGTSAANPNTAQTGIANTGFTAPTLPSGTASSMYFNFFAYCRQAGIPLTTIPGFGNASASDNYRSNNGIGVLDYLRLASNTTSMAGGPSTTIAITTQIIRDLDFIYDGAIRNASLSNRARLLQTSTNGIASISITDLLRVVVPSDGLTEIATYIGNTRNSDNSFVVTISTGALRRASLTRNSVAITNPISDTSLNLLTGVAALLGTSITDTSSAFITTATNFVTSPQSLLPAVTGSSPVPAQIRLSSFPDTVVRQAYGWLVTGTATTESLTVLISAATGNDASTIAVALFATTNLTSANGFAVVAGTTVTQLLQSVATSSGGSVTSTALLASQLTVAADGGKIAAARNLLALLRNETGTAVSAVNNVLSLTPSGSTGWSGGFTPTHLMIYGLGLARTSDDNFDTLNAETALTLPTLSPAWANQTGTRPNYFIRYIPAFFTFLQANPGAMSAAFSSSDSDTTRQQLGNGIAQLINAGGAISGRLNIPSLITLFGGNSNFASFVLNSTPLSVVTQGIFADLVPILQTIGVDALSKSFGAGGKSADVTNASNAQIIMSNWALAFTDPNNFPALQQAGFRITDLLSYTRTMTRYSGRGDVQNVGATAGSSTISVLAFDVLHERCLTAYGINADQVRAIALAQGIILA